MEVSRSVLGKMGREMWINLDLFIYFFLILGSAASTVLTWKNVKGLS